jgi:HAD superfamily hydrolase (TIGR01509 family)
LQPGVGLSFRVGAIASRQEPKCPVPNKKRVMTLQAGIFDCDGLLADTETPDFEAWRAIYADHDLPFPLEEWAQTIGIAKGHELRDWHTPLASQVGPAYDREAIQARRRAHYQAKIEVLRPMPGVIALLDALEAEGIPCAVASNSDHSWVERILGITGLRSRFLALATADEVAQPKPAPDVYLLAAQKLGVAPNACIAFEDSPRGLTAAHAAGMLTVAVPTQLTRHLTFPEAHLLVETLEGLTPSRLSMLSDTRG